MTRAKPAAALLLLLACALTVSADDPKPPWQRLLTGADAKRAAELAAAVNRFEEADRYAEAILSSQELLALRTQIQGMDHYETVEAKYHLLATQKAAALPLERRRVWRQTRLGALEANRLIAKARYAQAQPLVEAYLNSRRAELGERHPDTAMAYNGLAQTLVRQGQVAEAGPLFPKILAIRRETLGEDHPVTAQSYTNLALSLGLSNQADDVGPLFEKALAIRRRVQGEDHPETASSYDNLAYHLNAQGKAAAAEPLYDAALRIRRRVLGEFHIDTGMSYNNLAGNLSTQNKAVEAGPYFAKALAIALRSGGEEDRYTATMYSNVACNLDAQGKAAEARPLHERALAIHKRVLGENHQDTAYSYSNLAYHLNAQNQAAEAGPLLAKALAIRRRVLGENHPDLATSYADLAHTLEAQGQASEGEALHKKALAIRLRAFGADHPNTATAYHDLAGNLIVQGKVAEAMPLLLSAVSAHESGRLASASGFDRASLGRFNPRHLVAVTQLADDPAGAWGQFELTLGRSLLDHQVGETLDPADLANLTRERQLIAGVQPQILQLVTKGKLSGEESALLALLIAGRQAAERRVTALRAQASTSEVATSDAIRTTLPADAALLLWVDVAENSGSLQEHWACVVRATGDPKWERLPGTGAAGQWSRDDAGLPSQFRAALAGKATRSEVEALAARLHAQRIAPVARHLAGVKTLYVVPVHRMAGVPVEVLTADYAVSYVPSGTYLARLKGRARPAGTRLLALGDPAFGDLKDLAPVPGTRVEVERLRVLAGADATVLTGGDASERRLEALRAAGELATFRYLHFATHGQGNDVRAFESALILAKDTLPQELTAKPGAPFLNGQLSAGEVLEFWKLDADLVTLSACETAVGKAGGGDGLLGFAQAFLSAGARSVCLSLWKVDDAATALLMSRFYENLLGKRPGLAKPMGKAAALDEAKRWLRALSAEEARATAAALAAGVPRAAGERINPVKPPAAPAAAGEKPFTHPKFWAAFVLLGDPN